MVKINIDTKKEIAEVEGNVGEILSAITALLLEMYKDNSIDSDDLDKIVTLVKNPEEIQKGLRERLEKRKKVNEKIDKLLDEVINDLFGE